MILSDYHVHTNLTDGKNSLEEMILRAVSIGMKTIGFAEHSYVSFDPACRLNPNQSVYYRKELQSLKKKYKDIIEVLCGIEMDYDADTDPDSGFAENPAFYDYVIGSVHYLDVKGERYSIDVSPEETRKCVNRLFGGDYDSYAEAYYEKVARLGERWSVPVNIIGHFDLVTKFLEEGQGPNTDSRRYRLAWQGAMDALRGKCTFEINMGAVVRGYRSVPYPQINILKRLKALGGNVVISGDCHSADTLLWGFDRAKVLAEETGFIRWGFRDNKGLYHEQN